MSTVCMKKSSNHTAKTFAFAVCKNVIKQVVKVETVQYQQLYRLQTECQERGVNVISICVAHERLAHPRCCVKSHTGCCFTHHSTFDFRKPPCDVDLDRRWHYKNWVLFSVNKERQRWKGLWGSNIVQSLCRGNILLSTKTFAFYSAAQSVCFPNFCEQNVPSNTSPKVG